MEAEQANDYLDYDSSYGFWDWLNISQCVTTVAAFLLNAFLMTAILLDRRSYKKTRLISLTNYTLSYTLFSLITYFYMVHLGAFLSFKLSTCLLLAIIHEIFSEYVRYFMLPICCDYIVKYSWPKEYESGRFQRLQFIFIAVLWLSICVTKLILILAFTDYTIDSCFPLIPYNLYFTRVGFQFIFACLMVFCLFSLVYTAVKCGDNEHKSTTIALIIVVILWIVDSIKNGVFWARSWQLIHASAIYAPYTITLICFTLIPFAWLIDVNIRQSILRIFTERCKKSENVPQNELAMEQK